MTKANIHLDICNELNELYQRKNHDYGDSFGKSFREWGFIAACMRLSDKMERLKAYAKGGDQKVKDESPVDTLMDLANYAIMSLVEMKLEGEQHNESHNNS